MMRVWKLSLRGIKLVERGLNSKNSMANKAQIKPMLTDAIRQAAKGKEVTAEEIESKIVPMAVDAMKSGNIAVNPRVSRQQDIEALYRKAL